MKNVRINVHNKRTDIVGKERNEKNISMVNYVSIKRKLKREKMNVNVSHDSWEVRLSNRRSNKGELVRVMESPN